MQAASARAADVYYQAQVQSRSPLELVVMLYDGMIRFLTKGRQAIEQHDFPAKRDALSRALAVLSELQSTLNMDQGADVSRSLDRLYHYVNQRILDANAHNDVAALEESIRLLTPLRNAWAEIASAPVAALARP